MQQKNYFESKSVQSQPLKKQWKVAATRFGHITQKQTNSMVELAFMQFLKLAKVRLAKMPCRVFEKDERNDNSQDAFRMHNFISPSFYCALECSLTLDYHVEYAFYNCICEDELRTLLHTYPLDAKAKEVVLKPDFTNFYKNVLAYQDSKHTYIL